jgi:hypothetical protein
MTTAPRKAVIGPDVEKGCTRHGVQLSIVLADCRRGFGRRRRLRGVPLLGHVYPGYVPIVIKPDDDDDGLGPCRQDAVHRLGDVRPDR